VTAVEEYANVATTTVSSGGTDAPSSGTVETWTVASSAPFPAAAAGSVQFHVADPAASSEMMLVTNISGTTWTVTRGAESTTPVAHTAGFTIWLVVTAGDLTALATQAFVTAALAAALPFPQGLFTLTDAPTIEVDASAGSVLRCTLNGDRTLGTPSNPADGQPLLFEFIQGSGGGFTLGFSAAYAFPASIPQPSMSTTAGQRDFLQFRYDAGESLWNCIGWVPDQNAGVATIPQGGTGQVTQQAALNALAGAQTSGLFLRGNGVNVVLAAIQAADLPAGTTSAQGALQLDGTAGDIQPVGTAAVAGAKGEAADAEHVHLGFFGGIFGTGADGSVTFDGTTTILGMVPSASVYTMTRDIQCTSITINNGVTLKPAGYRIFCRGTVTNNGTITVAGNAATAGAAGAATGSTSLGGGLAGGAGGTGANGSGAAPAVNASFGSAGGAGGAGTSGGAGNGGTAGVSNTIGQNNVLQTPYAILTGIYFYALTTRALSWGGAGGGGGSDAGSNAGGGGGSGGGIIAILAFAVINNGTITVQGGNGANGTGGNAGGGGSGSGGLIVAYTLVAWTAGTLTVSAGTPGSKAGSGTGSNGNSGGVGLALNVVLS
jgi:hypothetical protein